MARRVVCIVGSGRTGTHWIGTSIGRSGFTVLGEQHPLFQLSVLAALGRVMGSDLLHHFSRSVESTPGDVVLKWHPCLWHGDALLHAFPELVIVSTHRRIGTTVRSMLGHAGTRRWVEQHERYDSIGRADDFLGRSWSARYAKVGTAERCAMRAASHALEGSRLAHRHPARVARFFYDAAAQSGEAYEVGKMLGIDVRLEQVRATEHPELSPDEGTAVGRVEGELRERLGKSTQ